MSAVPPNRVAVVVVAYNAEAFILDCLASVLASVGADVRVVLVDNASSDGTSAAIRSWVSSGSAHAPGPMPIELAPVDPPEFAIVPPGGHLEGELAPLTLVQASENGGFAAGVNHGLRIAQQDQSVELFWVLNPDSVATPGAAAAFLRRADAEHGVVTGRACYFDSPETIQIDGGRINWRTGVTSNANVGQPAAETPMPHGDDIDFAFGGNMAVTRAFLERCGEMPEDYFLYYEEVDWSLKRGAFKLATAQDALIYHRAGASIGSPVFGKRAASPFSLYFKHRARTMFVRRYRAAALPTAWAYSMAKASQVALGGDLHGAIAILRGGFGLGPPKAVAKRLSATPLSHLAPVRS